MSMPVNKIVITKMDHAATGTATMVMQIRETTADHNIVVELLRGLYQQYPGPWYQFQLELKKMVMERGMCKCGEKLQKFCQCIDASVEKAKPVKDEERIGVTPT